MESYQDKVGENRDHHAGVDYENNHVVLGDPIQTTNQNLKVFVYPDHICMSSDFRGCVLARVPRSRLDNHYNVFVLTMIQDTTNRSSVSK